MRVLVHLAVLLAAASLSLVACAPSKKMPSSMPVLTQPVPPPPVPHNNPGSLFDAGQNSLLFEDDRARRVGDIVLVRVVETSSGSHAADTTSNKDSSYQAGVTNYFGKGQVQVAGFKLPGTVGSDPMVGANTTSKFSSTGETSRESDLTAAVGARVIRVLPDGLLQVEGARQMRINEETQILVVRGLVRSRDIGPDNSITSNKMANAEIEYYGQGVLADKQKPGWMARILDNLWPF